MLFFRSLFKQLAKKYQKMTGNLKTTPTTTPTSATPTTPESATFPKDTADYVRLLSRAFERRKKVYVLIDPKTSVSKHPFLFNYFHFHTGDIIIDNNGNSI